MSVDLVFSARSLHEQDYVIFNKREALCILMQYEIEMLYTFGITAFKFFHVIFSFT